MTLQDDTKQPSQTQLRQMLADNFSLDDLHTLCQDIGVDFDELGGDGKTAKIRELIEYVSRRNLLDDLLLAAARARPGVAWPGASQVAAENPYRGLFAFREEDADLFFGRDDFAGRLTEAVQARSLVAVVGASGSGKSSVVFAGLLPRLRQMGGWLAVDFRPKHDPFLELARALTPLLYDDEVDLLTQTRKLAAALAEGDLPLADVAARILQKQQQADHLLLIADQFEELYTLTSETGTRQRFLDVLLAGTALRQAQDTPFSLVLTLRADFLGQALAYRPLADALDRAAELLGPMNRAELGETIEKPAAQRGVQFEAGLVERILDDVGGEPGNLPLLEFALEKLWEQQRGGQLTHVGYEQIGRVQGALAAYAEEAYAGLTEAEKAQARRSYVQLVQPGAGTEDTRRLATRSEVGEANWPLITKLATARLLVTDRDESGQETVEVVHEALIKRWGRLQEWMAEDRIFREWQERLRAALRGWEASGQDAGALLRGAQLGEAEGWLEERGMDLPKEEADFIQESLAARQKRERQRKMYTIAAGAAAGLFLILAVLFGLSRQDVSEALGESEQLRGNLNEALATSDARVVAIQTSEAQTQADSIRIAEAAVEAQEAEAIALTAEAEAIAERDEAERQRRIAQARELAAQSAAVLERDYRLGLRYAYEGVNLTHNVDGTVTSEAYAALQNALSTAVKVPDTVLFGHTDSVNTAAFSPDGTRLVTASNDDTARLWDAAGQPLAVLEGHTGGIRTAAFSPDGTRLVTASDDGTARLWDAAGQPLAVLEGHTGGIRTAAFSPDGTRLVTASWDRTARLWDAAGQPLAVLEGHTARVNTAAFSPDGTRLVTASDDGTARLWDAAGQPLAVLEGHTSIVWTAAFNPDGTRLVTASDDGTARLWDAAGQPLAVLEGHTASVWTAAFSPDGTRLVTASWDGTARLWDAAGRPLAVLAGHTDAVWTAAFSPDGTRLVTASWDGTARLWDGKTGQPLATLEGHTRDVNTVAFSPDGTRLVTASSDGTARLWDADGQPMAVLEGHTDTVNTAEFSPDGTRLVTASDDGTARLWDADGQPLAVLEGHTESVRTAAFSPDGTRLVTASDDGTARLWDAGTGQPLAVLAGHTAAFSPDGTRLVTASGDRTAWLWDAAGRPLAVLEGHTGIVLTAAFSPDGTRLVTASWDGTARLWDAAGQPLAVLEGHTDAVWTAAFSPDGTRLVTASADGTARLWDAAGQPLAVLEGHTHWVWAAAFSPDGTRLVTASRDGTARLWDGKTGQPLATLEGYTDPVRTAAFSPDGTRLVTVSRDGTARLWDAGTGQPLAVLEGHMGAVWVAAFNPNGMQLVTASDDGTTRLWDGKTGQPLAVLEGHTARVRTAAFSPDGTRLVMTSDDGTARLWTVYPTVEAMLAEAKRRLVLILSPDECLTMFDAATCDQRAYVQSPDD